MIVNLATALEMSSFLLMCVFVAVETWRKPDFAFRIDDQTSFFIDFVFELARPLRRPVNEIVRN